MSEPKQAGNTGLALAGSRTTGEDVRAQNVLATTALANVVKTSLGPVGLDKMLVDDIGDVLITNDGATILKQLDVEHPAAKILVELSDLQDSEVGDGTTSVVILAAELIKHAHELVKQKIHPTSIISGYRLAQREAVKYIKDVLAHDVASLGEDALVNAARTSLSSKILGNEMDVFARMAVDAVQAVKSISENTGKARYPVKAINILKAHGGSAKESKLVNGFAINCLRASQDMPRQIKNAKIAILDMSLQKTRMQMGVQVLVNDVSKLEDIRKEEENITRRRVEMILASGAKVIATTRSVDDLAVKLLAAGGAMAIRHCKKEDLKRLARATGGQLLTTFANLDGEESIDPAALGGCDEVVEERINDYELLFFRGCKTQRSQTIILRGANEHMLDEMERSLHDSLCVVKRVLESKKVVPGGGCVEAALSIYLDKFATSLGSREQLAIAQFAESLLVIPKQLAVNAAKDATDLTAKLRAYHNAAQTKPDKKGYANYGLDLVEGVVRDNLKAGVLEPVMSKVKSIQFATEAAITILRIDDMIKLNPPPQEDGGHH